jgi:pilus assembly protein CpaF
VARDGRHELTTTILTADEVRDLVERMLKSSGRRLDLSSPFVDATLPSGHRLHVVLDGIARGCLAVNIHRQGVHGAARHPGGRCVRTSVGEDKTGRAARSHTIRHDVL